MKMTQFENYSTLMVSILHIRMLLLIDLDLPAQFTDDIVIEYWTSVSRENSKTEGTILVFGLASGSGDMNNSKCSGM